MGGKNPNIIFADCDLDDAVNTSVLSSFANQGEICLCGSRIIVQEEIYEEFVARFVERVKSTWICGPPLDEKSKMSAVISKEHRGETFELK